MITIDGLREFGADVDDGLARCMNKADFYLRMVNMGLKDARFEGLGAKIAAKDWEGAFEDAHALKGVLGNLALTPLFAPASELTERLRAKTDADCAGLYGEMMKKRVELMRM